MNEKMKSCFSAHVLMHSLFGLGLGVLLVTVIPSLRNVWLGVVAMAVAVVLDATRRA